MTVISQNSYKGFERAFCVRMKSTLTKRGCHFKSSGYRVSKLMSFERNSHIHYVNTKASFSLKTKQKLQLIKMDNFPKITIVNVIDYYIECYMIRPFQLEPIQIQIHIILPFYLFKTVEQ